MSCLKFPCLSYIVLLRSCRTHKSANVRHGWIYTCLISVFHFFFFFVFIVDTWKKMCWSAINKGSLCKCLCKRLQLFSVGRLFLCFRRNHVHFCLNNYTCIVRSSLNIWNCCSRYRITTLFPPWSKLVSCVSDRFSVIIDKDLSGNPEGLNTMRREKLV